MNEQLIGEVLEELRPALLGRPWGKIFQLSGATLAVDFRTGDGRYLLLSAEPGRPRLHLIARSVRELERAAQTPSPFALILRKALGGGVLLTLTKDEGERVVRFGFAVPDAAGAERDASLVAQLTGRTSNLFLLGAGGRVVASLRPARGEGQAEGDVYEPPQRRPAAEGEATTGGATTQGEEKTEGGATTQGEARTGGAAKTKGRPPDIPREGFVSLSEALDRHFVRQDAERAFDARAASARARLRQQIASLRKLRDNLARDLAAHGDADEHKRAGDLLLANVGTAVRDGGRVRLTDFYAEDAPTIELEVDENRSLQDEAARRFARYTKAKRAAREISERLEKVGPELAALEARLEELEGAVAARDESALAALAGEQPRTGARPDAARAKTAARAKGSKKNAVDKGRTLRRYRSSDGYEIVVGRGARENDELTFRVARSYDTWMHAADYPGSHVVVRARSRDEAVPHRTLVEAARLAANFSQARKDGKVAVNYTQRKFVSKPKGAAPGLVYLSSFRTLLVEPAEELERI
ncbi:MAG TPA: NFACT family protein [Pyrinomonadaceae bacterium]|jgi:predicted ribosome quality control (RQC) complex YloA/Tae2 family protein